MRKLMRNVFKVLPVQSGRTDGDRRTDKGQPHAGDQHRPDHSQMNESQATANRRMHGESTQKDQRLS